MLTYGSWAAFAYLLSACTSALAVEPYREYRKRVEAAETISALNDGPFGESLSLYHGATQFSVTDIDPLVNNELPVRLQRRFSVKLEPSGQYTYNPDRPGARMPDVKVPYITGMFLSPYTRTSKDAGSQRCSAMTAPSSPGTGGVYEAWCGCSVHAPGGTDCTLLLTGAQTLQATEAAAHRWTTRERNAFSCIPVKSGTTGEGVSMVTRERVRHDSGVSLARAAGVMARICKSAFEGSITVSSARDRVFPLASRITARS